MEGQSKSIAEIRSDVCNTTLIWLSALSVPLFWISASLVLQIGWQPVLALHGTAVIALCVITLARRRIAYIVRASYIVFAMFLAACGGLSNFGSPAGLPYFTGAGVMAAVLFGRRAGVATVALALLATFAAFLGYRHGILHQPDLNIVQTVPTSWIANASGVVISALGPIAAVSAYHAHLNAERTRAEESSRAKADFLATISHELRTPMTAILGLSELIGEGPLEPQLRERVARIHDSGKGLLGLLDDVLDFSKIERGQIALETVPFNLPALLRDIETLFAPMAEKKGLAFELAMDIGDHAAVAGDPTRLRQILVNLVGNAVKFTDEGFVRVTAEIAARASGLLLSVTVADTGIGISPAQLEQLFQPFTQGDGTITRRFGGTGLGLAISRRLVGLMRGALRVSSQEGAGAQFTVTLPLAVGDAAAASPAAAPLAGPRLSRQPRRILVADDNETLRYLTQAMLESRGHAVTCVGNGAEALAALRSSRHDVVLLDVHMPVMDGIATVKAIRAEYAAGLPVYALTADVIPERRQSLAGVGFTAVLTKPFDWAVLHRLIDGEGAAAERAPAAGGGEVLDRALLDGLAQSLGPAATQKILTRLSALLPQYLADLAAALEAGDLRRTSEIAHSMKGGLAQFGAARAADLAGRIEGAASLAEARALLPEIAAAMRALDAEIASLRAA